MERELSYLTVHSVLHLLGYDHLDEGPMKARMRAREEAILGGTWDHPGDRARRRSHERAALFAACTAGGRGGAREAEVKLTARDLAVIAAAPSAAAAAFWWVWRKLTR